MKFESSDFFKHDNGIDAFLWVHTVVMDSGEAAIVHAWWLVQGVEKYWWTGESQRIFIKKDQYEHWKSYEPKGELL